jgi:electron transfer flavoprotein alpha/beta subunit
MVVYATNFKRTDMKILVCVSKTPDTTSKIAFTNGNTKFDEAGVQWIINPYDEWYALVRAIELKEKDASIVLHLVTVGMADCDPIIRKALALGGDEAIRVNARQQRQLLYRGTDCGSCQTGRLRPHADR